MVLLMVFVLYVDMDYFFAACEEVRHPDFKGKPLVVGTAKESERFRGVVQTANYEARKYGIHSGMPNMKAFELYKELTYLHSDEEYYESISAKIVELLKSYKRPVEVVSVDEEAIDITGLTNEEAIELAKEIKGRIKDEFKLTCTIGISTGKAFAKMASDKAKPDGLMLIKVDELAGFLDSCKIEELPGVGSKTREKLGEIGIDSIRKLSKADPMVLIDSLGSAGKELYMLANGIDESKVVESSEVLSIGREVTLKNPAATVEEIKQVIEKLTDEVIKDVDNKGLNFKSVGAKVRYTDFSTSIKSRSLHNYTNSKDEVITQATAMIRELLKNGPARKVGVRVSRFIESRGQKKLF